MLKIKTILTSVSTLVLVFILSGCGKGGIEAFSAPETAPVKAIFDQACAKCHGNDGGGKFGLMFTLKPAGKTPEALAEFIFSGNKGMPAFPKLSEKQRLALGEYILKIRK